MTQQPSIQKQQTSGGLEFRDGNGTVYLCTNDHRGNASSENKSCWAVTEDTEFDLFVESRDRGQKCDSGHIWGFGDREGQTVLGTKEEVIAKFTGVSVWHGYPIICKETRPPTKLVKRLRDELKVISPAFANRIMLQKV